MVNRVLRYNSADYLAYFTAIMLCAQNNNPSFSRLADDWSGADEMERMGDIPNGVTNDWKPKTKYRNQQTYTEPVRN